MAVLPGVTLCGFHPGFGMQQGLRLAKQHQQDWLMHIDLDEVVYTMAESFSLATCERFAAETAQQ